MNIQEALKKLIERELPTVSLYILNTQNSIINENSVSIEFELQTWDVSKKHLEIIVSVLSTVFDDLYIIDQSLYGFECLGILSNNCENFDEEYF